MMGISFTERQQSVIDARGRNLLVSAAAGSGKTAVLVERIVKMVSDGEHPVDIDRLLVVTFTNAAASEMRERISKALNDRLAAQPENEHLQRQVTLLHNARITTIDSFCLFVLRNQFHTIGLDPGFRIAEEGEVRLMRQDVLAAVLEEQYAEEDEAFLSCMEYFNLGSRDTAVEEIVLKCYDFAMSTPFPEEWLEERKNDYRVAVEENGEVVFEKLPWVAELLRQTRLLLEGCAEKLSGAIHMCEEPDGPYMYGELLEQEREMVWALLGKCAGDYDALYTAFGAIHFDRLPSRKDVTVSAVKREVAKNIRTKVKDQLVGLQKKYFYKNKEGILAQMEACGRAVEALADLTLAFKRAFDARKRDKNLLDFSDIEHYALSILVRREEKGKCAPTETALEYRRHFHEILIDEYQDSNLVQEYILSCISGEDEGRYNRFMVGDVKQSIYKFRLARPELFLEKYEAYGRGDYGRNAGKIDLHQNFRSRREVLASVNGIFEQIMGKEVGGIVYDDLAALHMGADYPAQSAAGDETPARDVMEAVDSLQDMADGAELMEAGTESEEPAQDGRKIEEITQEAWDGAANPNATELLLFRTADKPDDVSIKEQEAQGVAAKIRELMRTFLVTDKETGTLRRPAFRDIVILLRTTAGWDEVFKEALEREGIPVHMTSRTGYFAAGEVQEILHFLRVLDNPLQDIPLYGVMHSYLGGFTEEEIALIRASYPKKKYLYDAVEACTGVFCAVKVTDAPCVEEAYTDVPCAEETCAHVSCAEEAYTDMPCVEVPCVDAPCTGESAISPQLAEKLKNFLDCIGRYRELSVYLSVQELLQAILRETDYLNYVTARPEGNKRRANVEMLLVKAADYERTSYFGLYHFLRYMEQLEKYEVDYGEAGLLDENADVVRIMSIHKSKGLEFPICFVSGLAKGFQTRDTSGHLVLDIDAGIGVDYVNPGMRVRGRDLRRNVIAEKLKVDNLAEEMRILYVAMTRAKEKLILTGTVKTPDKTAASLLPLRQRRGALLPYDVLLDSGSFLELLLSALARNQCMDGLYREYGLEPEPANPLYGRDICICVRLSGWTEAAEAELTEAVRMEAARRRLLLSDPSRDVDTEFMTVMSDRFAYQYPHGSLRNLYTKTTVSELKMAGMREETDFSFHLYEEETVVPYLPGFLEKEERVSGSMRGSAFHKVMELFDFTKLTGEVNANRDLAAALLEEQLAGMRRDGRLTEEYEAVISVPKIVGFLTSGVARRMGEAARAGRLCKEQPFVMGLSADRLSGEFPREETVLIQGIIDVFFEEEGRYVLLDYKTDAVETAEELVRRYHMQLDYYAEALEQASGYRDTERILYSFRLGEEILL